MLFGIEVSPLDSCGKTSITYFLIFQPPVGETRPVDWSAFLWGPSVLVGKERRILRSKERQDAAGTFALAVIKQKCGASHPFSVAQEGFQRAFL